MYGLHVSASAPTVSVHVPDEMIDGLLRISPRPGLEHQSALRCDVVLDVTIHPISQRLLIGFWGTDWSVNKISC